MVNNIEKDLKNDDGSIETLIITSNNNANPLNKTKTYKLANYTKSKENTMIRNFKNSILGTEIGIKAEGFTNMAILATLIAIGGVILMYVTWRI